MRVGALCKKIRAGLSKIFVRKTFPSLQRPTRTESIFACLAQYYYYYGTPAPVTLIPDIKLAWGQLREIRGN